MYISGQSLSSEETRALVRAMESVVTEVFLGDLGDVSLDMTALTQYSGQGKCVGVRYEEWSDESAARNIEQLRCWAQRVNWPVEVGRDTKWITLNRFAIFEPNFLRF